MRYFISASIAFLLTSGVAIPQNSQKPVQDYEATSEAIEYIDSMDSFKHDALMKGKQLDYRIKQDSIKTVPTN